MNQAPLSHQFHYFILESTLGNKLVRARNLLKLVGVDMFTLLKLRSYPVALARVIHYVVNLLVGSAVCLGVTPLFGAELPQTIKSVKPSIVGIGTYQKTRSPAFIFRGTGFAVSDGLHVVTNAHVIPEMLDVGNMESLVVISAREGGEPELRSAVKEKYDKEHDLTLLKISGEPLPTLSIGDSSAILEGQSFAFTGFPIGVVLGFHPVTHRGMLSSITPVVLPVSNANQLDAKTIRMQRTAYSVFQLDGTAYPGNSGSPLYDPQTGIVYGIINMVFVKGFKESALTHPSGITYAIPGNYVNELLR